MATNLGVSELLILLAVQSTGDRAHGVAVRQAVAASRGREVSSGAVHTTLERLERRGLVVSRVGEAVPQRGGRPRRYYQLTEPGAAAVELNLTAVAAALRSVKIAQSGA